MVLDTRDLPSNTLRLLETRIGVITRMLMEMPSRISKLKGKYSSLVKRFKELRYDLNKPAI